MGGIRTTLVLAVLGCLLALASPTASEADPLYLATPSRATGEVSIVAWAATTTQRIDLKIDGQVVASCPTWWCQYMWQSSTVPNGNHVVKAIAYSPPTIVTGQVARTMKVLNAAGATTPPTVTDTTPPAVTLRVPAAATGVVSLQASATDNTRVVTTEIFVDDVRVATSTTAQASFPWNTTATANGPHRIRAVARDAAGNVGSSASVVQVSNVPVSNATGIPERARWEAQMVAYGRRACDWLQTPGLTLDERLAHVYYDQIRVMYQLADYTEDPSWNACAARAAAVYRDGYVLPNGGAVPGYWNFTTGLREDVERTGNQASRTAVVQLSQSAMYAGDWTPLEWTQDTGRSREVAYAILSYINAQALGEPARPRRSALVDQAYGHLDQWFVWYTWRDARQQFSPFMVALTAHSLIRDWEQTHDARLVPALRRAADWLWGHAWDPVKEGMVYDVNGVDGPARAAPDLNLLIAPMYAFLYWQTGLTPYRDQADALFAEGVRDAYLKDGKHFDQNYWWSFDYIRWRDAR